MRNSKRISSERVDTQAGFSGCRESGERAIGGDESWRWLRRFFAAATGADVRRGDALRTAARLALHERKRHRLRTRTPEAPGERRRTEFHAHNDRQRVLFLRISKSSGKINVYRKWIRADSRFHTWPNGSRQAHIRPIWSTIRTWRSSSRPITVRLTLFIVLLNLLTFLKYRKNIRLVFSRCVERFSCVCGKVACEQFAKKDSYWHRLCTRCLLRQFFLNNLHFVCINSADLFSNYREARLGSGQPAGLCKRSSPSSAGAIQSTRSG